MITRYRKDRNMTYFYTNTGAIIPAKYSFRIEGKLTERQKYLFSWVYHHGLSVGQQDMKEKFVNWLDYKKDKK